MAFIVLGKSRGRTDDENSREAVKDRIGTEIV
jgi:hypothetical protein